MKYTESNQRTNEWYTERLGKITASESYLLMTNSKRPMTAEELTAWKAANPKSRVTTVTESFSQTARSWLSRKAMERLLPIGVDAADETIQYYIDLHNASSRATDFGTEMEPVARNAFAEAYNLDVLESGFVPLGKYPDFAGGSPDGVIPDDDSIIEIKCPYTLEKHCLHLSYNSPQELKEHEPEYFYQCLFNLLCTGASKVYFISYCPFLYTEYQLHVLTIERSQVEDDIRELEARISEGVEFITNLLSTIKK